MGKAAKHWRRAGSALAVVLMVGAGAGSAQADDGIGGFFQQIFGGGGHASSEPLPQPYYDYGEPSSRPLTVRPRRQHRRPASTASLPSREKYSPEELKNVTMFTDRTLVPGDAVMTAQGVRIFNGPEGSAHTEADFVALSPKTKLSKDVRTQLIAIDSAARSDFRAQ